MSDGKGIWFQIAPPEAGFLYLLSYGKEPDGRSTFRMAFPLKGGSAARPGGESLRVPETGSFAQGPEKDDVYLVWSQKPVPAMEELKTLRQDHGMSVVEGDKMGEVQSFLRRFEVPNEQVLVRKMSLESR